MAIISTISVTVDRSNYSRYSSSHNTVTATVSFTPTSAVTDTITVNLCRRSQAQGFHVLNLNNPNPTTPYPTGSADFVIATKTINLVAGTSPQIIQFNLTEVRDIDGFMWARHSMVQNDYYVSATTTTNVTAKALFSVLPIVVEEMKNHWISGAPLITFEKLAPVLQPQVVTGVVINSVSFGSSRGPFALAWNHTASTLQWGTGNPTTIVSNLSNYVLSDTVGNSVTISASLSAMPGSSVTENVLIDFGLIPDESIIQQIIQTTLDTEQGLMSYLEPTYVVARNIVQFDPANAPASYDVLGDGVPFYQSRAKARWPVIEIPYTNILHIARISGFFNKSLTVNLDANWITHSVGLGITQLVPSNYATLMWAFAGQAFYSLLVYQDYLPEFWAYQIVAGVREGIQEDIRQYIGAAAAINLLVSAGLARYPAGVTSYSLSRDGVAESRGILPAVYGGIIDQLKSFIGRDGHMTDRLLVKLRERYSGYFAIVL